MARLMALSAAASLLTACAETSIQVSYDDGAGKVITASYRSTKDVAAPSFTVERDEQGRVQRIVLSAENADASTPQAAYNAAIGTVVEGAVRGAIGAAGRAVPGVSYEMPARYQPADLHEVETLLRQVHQPAPAGRIVQISSKP
jgi:hypothetical protein